MDCSGSVSQEDLKDFTDKLTSLWQDLSPKKLVLMSFDTEVNTYQVFNKGDTFKPKYEGGGGTNFSPVFEKIKTQGEEVDVCVVLTDLCSNDFGPDPGYPVLWIDSYGQRKAPWGEVVIMQK